MNNVHFAIPEIYGETLSYYELLRKLVDKTNELIDNYNTVPEQIAEAVENLDILNQLIASIATDNTKSTNAVKDYNKHDLLYATFNESVNLYESLIDFTTGTELSIGTNIREVNISELFIEIRKLIEDETHARKQADTALQQNITAEASARETADNELRELIRESSSGVTEAQLNEEITNRQNADNTLQTNIDNVNERFGNLKFVYQSNTPVKFTSSRKSDALTPPENAVAILSVNGGPPDCGWTYIFYNNQFKIVAADNIMYDRSFNMNIVWACTQ